MILPEDEMMVLNKGMFGGTLENKIEAQALSGMYLKNSDNETIYRKHRHSVELWKLNFLFGMRKPL